MMKKNETVTLRIEDLTYEGLGIGHAEGMAVFVKDAMIGDEVQARIVKVKKNYCYGRLLEVCTPGPDRVKPRCSCASACGGCQIQQMDYAAQLRFKQEKVRDQLIRIGGFGEELLDEVTDPILGMEAEGPWRYRNKGQFPVGYGKDGNLVAGFYAGRTHSIIEQLDCVIGAAENKEILETVLRFMEREGITPYHEGTKAGLVRHVVIRKGFVTGQLMVVLVLNGEKLPGEEELARELWRIPGMTCFAINTNTKNTNVIFADQTRTVTGQDHIEDEIDGLRFRISPRAFFQVNPIQTRKLYETALEFSGLTGQEIVWDLYCGIGSISLFLARKAKAVYGVEIIPEAIENARENAKRNGIYNTRFFVGKAEEVLPKQYEKAHMHADVIVVDPPRKGCERAVLDTMIAMTPRRIVYVSCDPATLARDLQYLCSNGYELKRVRPCDMFCHSVHCEVVVSISRVGV